MKYYLPGTLNLLVRTFSSAFVVFITLMLISCGGGGGGGGGGGTGDNPTALLKGMFIDSPVEGLSYRTPSRLGVTDYQGTFRYLEEEQVTFFLGDLELGQTEAQAIITPVDLVAGATGATDATVTNLCRFLQTLDVDGDPSNGIFLPGAVNAFVAGRSIDFSITPAAFGSAPDLLELLDDLNNQGVFPGGVRTLVSADQARSHLLATLGQGGNGGNEPVFPTEEDSFESNLRGSINGYRGQSGLGGLVFDPQLYQLARDHSANMAAVGGLSHDGFQGRYTNSGYRTCVENVAWNYPTPEALLTGWQNSPGHDQNLLSQNIGFVGIAKVGAYSTFFACGD